MKGNDGSQDDVDGKSERKLLLFTSVSIHLNFNSTYETEININNISFKGLMSIVKHPDRFGFV